LAYSNPKANRYRYMLRGLDNSWNEVGSDGRTVTYTSLPSGTYRLRVQGATVSSQWSEPGAELQIVILPPWWKTWWFIALCISAALILIWLVYHYRMLQVAKQFEIQLEAGINERTRIARELHDTLLQDFHGLMFQFQAVRNLMPRRPEDAMQSLDDAISDTKKALAEGRDAIQDLRSEEKNLAELLTVTSQELRNVSDTNYHSPTFELIEEGDRKTLSAAAGSEVGRIAIEILRNAYLHAHAHRIEAEIRYGNQMLRLRIRDDGEGIDPEVLRRGGSAGHWGLRGVHERAERIGAKVEFWSEAGAGTEVDVEVPAAIAYGTSPDGIVPRLIRKVRNRAQRS
jgi:signal transduction histidine kinase